MNNLTLKNKSQTGIHGDQFIAEEDISVFKEDGREIVVVRKGQTVTRTDLIRYGVIEGTLPPSSGFADDLLEYGRQVKKGTDELTAKVVREKEEAKKEDRRQLKN